MQFTAFLLAALAVTTSAAPSSNDEGMEPPTSTPGKVPVGASEIPDGFSSLYTLLVNKEKGECYIRAATKACTATSGKIGHFDANANACDVHHGGGTGKFDGCHEFETMLFTKNFRFFDKTAKKHQKVKKGSLVTQIGPADDSKVVAAAHLGLQPNCAVGRKTGQSGWIRDCR